MTAAATHCAVAHSGSVPGDLLPVGPVPVLAPLPRTREAGRSVWSRWCSSAMRREFQDARLRGERGMSQISRKIAYRGARKRTTFELTATERVNTHGGGETALVRAGATRTPASPGIHTPQHEPEPTRGGPRRISAHAHTRHGCVVSRRGLVVPALRFRREISSAPHVWPSRLSAHSSCG